MNKLTADSSPTQARWVTCPSCGQRALYGPENPFRPFCTPVCKNIDFGAWASEEFAIEAQPDPHDDPGSST